VRAFNIASAEDRVGAFGRLAETLPDASDVAEDLLKFFSQIFVANVFIEQGGGVGEDIVERAGHFGADIIRHLMAGVHALDDHQIQDV